MRFRLVCSIVATIVIMSFVVYDIVHNVSLVTTVLMSILAGVNVCLVIAHASMLWLKKR